MASSSAPLGLELLVPAGVAQLGIVRARSEYCLTDADLQGLPRSAHPGAGVMFSVKDLASVAILKGYRERGQRVVRISRPDVSRAETLFLPVGIMTTVGEVKAMMPGRADLLGRRPELCGPSSGSGLRSGALAPSDQGADFLFDRIRR